MRGSVFFALRTSQHQRGTIERRADAMPPIEQAKESVSGQNDSASVMTLKTLPEGCSRKFADGICHGLAAVACVANSL